MDIEHPTFDELAPSLSDVEETGEAIIEDAHYKAVAKLGVSTGVYWPGLVAMGVPPKDATKLTREWMAISSWSED